MDFISWLQIDEAKDFNASQMIRSAVHLPSVKKVNILGWSVYFRDLTLEKIEKQNTQKNTDYQNKISYQQEINEFVQKLRQIQPAQFAQQSIENIMKTPPNPQYDPGSLLMLFHNDVPVNTLSPQMVQRITSCIKDEIGRITSYEAAGQIPFQLPKPQGNFQQYYAACLSSAIPQAVQALQQQVANQPEIPADQGLDKLRVQFEKNINTYLPIVQRGIAQVQAMGLRKNVRVPISVIFVDPGPTWKMFLPQKAAAPIQTDLYGKGYDGGGSFQNANSRTINSNSNARSPSGTPEICVQIVTGQDTAIEITRTVVHEISHAIFSTLPKEDQEEIHRMATTLPSPTNYGRTDYEKSTNLKSHQSGNEWFAEMIATILTNPQPTGVLASIKNRLFGTPKPKYSNQDLAKLKGYVGNATAPHYGIGYKNQPFRDPDEYRQS